MSGRLGLWAVSPVCAGEAPNRNRSASREQQHVSWRSAAKRELRGEDRRHRWRLATAVGGHTCKGTCRAGQCGSGQLDISIQEFVKRAPDWHVPLSLAPDAGQGHGKNGLRPRHVSSLRPQASTSSPDIAGTGSYRHGRHASSHIPLPRQTQPAIKQTAGKPLATTLLTAAAYHILCGAMPAKTANQTPAGLNMRAGAASWAAPHSPPPRGLALPLRYARARRNCWA